LKNEISVNYIQNLRSYLTENTDHGHYKYQTVVLHTWSCLEIRMQEEVTI